MLTTMLILRKKMSLCIFLSMKEAYMYESMFSQGNWEKFNHLQCFRKFRLRFGKKIESFGLR